eukprot:m.57810 g.57810  ORF g.57810 m.57810 type:complete len:284 (-) comp13750_c0_seq2:44-895(-)
MASFDDVWEDIYVRFFLNSRLDQREDVVRLGFLIEDAFWYYCDVIRDENQKLPNLKLKPFFELVFERWELLHKLRDQVDEAYSQFHEYKISIPTAGCILLDPTHQKVLLLKSYSNSWGFPRGKIDKNEGMMECAVRETLEESGYDCSSKIAEDQFLEHRDKDGKLSRLYIVEDVPENYGFAPVTKGEVADIQWHNVAELAALDSKKLKRFFLSAPFFKPLVNWIKGRKKQLGHTLAQAIQASPFGSYQPPDAARSSRAVTVQFPSAWKNIQPKLMECVVNADK